MCWTLQRLRLKLFLLTHADYVVNTRALVHTLWEGPLVKYLQKEEVDTRIKMILGLSNQPSVENYTSGYLPTNLGFSSAQH